MENQTVKLGITVPVLSFMAWQNPPTLLSCFRELSYIFTLHCLTVFFSLMCLCIFWAHPSDTQPSSESSLNKPKGLCLTMRSGDTALRCQYSDVLDLIALSLSRTQTHPRILLEYFFLNLNFLPLIHNSYPYKTFGPCTML